MPAPSPASVRENSTTHRGAPGREAPKKQRGSSQKSGSYLQDAHRSLPASLDAEKGVLCSILLDPARLIDECVTRQVTDSHFHLPAHALIFQSVVNMHNAQHPVEMISLTQWLADTGKLEEAGGHATIADLYTFVPSPANALYYIEILREKYLLRRIISTCGEYAARAYDEQNEVRMLLDEVEEKILKIGDDRFVDGAPPMKELAMNALDDVEKVIKHRHGIGGLATGFTGLDALTDGLHGGEMIVIAARPSMGKTAFAMNVAEHVALEGKKAVAVYSLEMSTRQLMQRLLCSVARVNIKKLRSQVLGQNQQKALVNATERLATTRMFIDDTPGLEIMELRARTRRLHKREKLDLIIIDYLQLLRSTTKRGMDNRQTEVAEISAGIKALAKELDLPIIVLAQLNRNPESRVGSRDDGKGGKPRLSDLRESGSIEQDADVVGLLWRQQYYAADEEAKKEAEGIAELLIAKQRNGPTGEIPLTFLSEFTRFEDRAINPTDGA